MDYSVCCPQYLTTPSSSPDFKLKDQLFKINSPFNLSRGGGGESFFLYLKDQNLVHEVTTYEHLHAGMERKEQPCASCSSVMTGKEKKSAQLHCWYKEIKHGITHS